MPQIISLFCSGHTEATSNAFSIRIGAHQSPPANIRLKRVSPITFSPSCPYFSSPMLFTTTLHFFPAPRLSVWLLRFIKRLVRRSFEPKVPLPPLLVRAAFCRDTLTEFVLGELPITKLCFTGPTDCWWFKQPDPRDAWWALPRPCSQTEILA